jgi:hypothetical protein
MRGGIPEGITSQIFAIGGGDLVTRETYEIDNLIVNASGRARPWTICIPAASNDSPEICDAFGTIYGDSLRCRTDYLRLIKGEPGGDDFKRKISRNEIFYFPDGDLEVLMEALGSFGVIEELRSAYARGAVFCGVGAGGAALGQMGFKGNQSVVPTLGLEKVGIGCLPEKVRASDPSAATKFKGLSYPGFILAYMTTLHIRTGKYRLLTNGTGGPTPLVVGDETLDVASKVEFELLDSLMGKGKTKKPQG